MTESQGDDIHRHVLIALFVSLLVGVAWLGAFLSDIRAKLLHISVSASSVLLLVQGILLTVEGQLTLGVLALTLAASDALWAARARDAAQSTGAVLDLVWAVIGAFPGVIAVAVGALALQVGYLLLWASTLRAVLTHGGSSAATVAAVAFLLFSLRWTLGTLQCVVGGVAGAVMRHWLQARAQEAAVGAAVPGQADAEFGIDGDAPVPGVKAAAPAPPSPDGKPRVEAPEGSTAPTAPLDSVELASPAAPAPVLALGGEGDGEEDWSAMGSGGEGSGGMGVAAGRAHMPLSEAAADSVTDAVTLPLSIALAACTTQLGALMQGTLLGVVTPVLWPLMRAGRRLQLGCGNGLLAGCGARVAMVAERLLARTHKYALVSVLWDRVTWSTAARRVWRELVARGTEAVVAADSTDRLVLCACSVGGVLVLLVTGVGVFVTHAIAVIAVFAVGFSGVALFTAIVDGADAGLIVAFTEAPELLSTAQWTVYHRFVRLAETHQLRMRRSGT